MTFTCEAGGKIRIVMGYNGIHLGETMKFLRRLLCTYYMITGSGSQYIIQKWCLK